MFNLPWAPLLALSLLTCAPVYAEDINRITWATDHWPGLTEANNTGLYDVLIKNTFAQQGVVVYKVDMPFKRAVSFGTASKVDFAGGVIKDTTSSPKHYQAPFPILLSPVSAFYYTASFVRPPKNIKDLIGKKVCSSYQMGASIGMGKDDYVEVRTKSQAFLMTLYGRCDVYIDDHDEMAKVIERNKPAALANKVNVNFNDFKRSTVGHTAWYMVTPKTPRGKAVMKLYVQGTKALVRANLFNAIYQSRGFEAPIINMN